MQDHAKEERLGERLDHILEGKDPDRPEMGMTASLEELRGATDKELELLLTDPLIGLPENAQVRDMAMNLLAERRGAKYVDDVVQEADKEGASWIKYVVSGESRDQVQTPAEKARETFKAYNNPLAEIIPDDVMSFVVDPNGTFYMRLAQTELLHMREFDLLMEEEISGILEPDRALEIHGLTALAQVHHSLVKLSLIEFYINGDDVRITTDHPMARIVHMRADDFLVVL